MIRFTVVWVRDAQDELADAWLSAPDRNAISDAANLIDSELAVDAAAKGIELSEGIRALFAPPLRVLFTVNGEDRIVEVLRVRRS